MFNTFSTKLHQALSGSCFLFNVFSCFVTPTSLGLLTFFLCSFSHAYEYEYGDLLIRFTPSVHVGANIRTQKRDENFLSHSSLNNVTTIGYIVGSSLLEPRSETLDINRIISNGLPVITSADQIPNGTTLIGADEANCGNFNPTFQGVYFIPTCFALAHPTDPNRGRFSANVDDGNLNYDQWDVFAAQAKWSLDTNIEFGDYGAFIRAFGFYDFAVMHQDVLYRDISADAKKEIGANFIHLLDAYVYGFADIQDKPISWRLGKQVINWGESTLIGGISSAINPLDTNILLSPTGTLKESTIPIGSAWLSVGLNDNTTLEAYYQYEFEALTIPPSASFFSFLDPVGAGGTSNCLGAGLVPEYPQEPIPGPGEFGRPDEFGFNRSANCITRIADNEPPDSGQFGLKLSMTLPDNNASNLSLYFLNYHEKLPAVSLLSGIRRRIGEQFFGLLPKISAEYFLDYKEDIQMLGASFNTVLSSGVALSGELSYSHGVPLQISTTELALSASGALATLVANAGLTGHAAQTAFIPALTSALQAIGFNVTDGLLANGSFDFRQVDDYLNSLTVEQGYIGGQLPNAPLLTHSYIKGYIERDRLQGQLTALQTFSVPWLKTSVLLVGEIAAQYFIDLPRADELRLEKAGVELRCNELDALPGPKNLFSTDCQPDDFSWGYAIAGQMEYSNVFGKVTVKPSFLLKHDVSGTPPGNGLFLEGRKILRLGVEFILDNLSVGTSYVNIFGNEENNVLNDRDFLNVRASYFFE